MAKALKDFFKRALVARIAQEMARAWPAFPTKAFVRDACAGLGELELLARGRHIAEMLHRHLPAKYSDAVDVLLQSLGPEHASDELLGLGMAPFFYLPHVTFVAVYGLDDFDVSMKAQHALTRRFTCEFSIRSFLERHPEATLAALERWTKDPSPHVRRLVSEGTRPRLPWAARVRWIDEAPERVLPLLETLKDDPSSVVRRSVANHLNDLSKARPQIAFDVAERWLRDPTPERRALVAHALRSAIKRAEPRALALLGFGARPRVKVTRVAFTPTRVAIGGKTRLELAILATGREAQTLAVDLVVHFVKASGRASPKVFKLKTLVLAPRASETLAKTISLAVHTTRKPQAGRHVVEALINGERFALGAFDVIEAARSSK